MINANDWKKNKGLRIMLLLLLAGISVNQGKAGLVEEEAEDLWPEPVLATQDPVVDCGLNLLDAAGKPTTNETIAGLPALYREASLHKDKEFMEYLLTIIYVESRFDKKAISSADARGLMQMTAIAVREAVGSCPSLKPLGNITKLHDSVTNVKYGSCFLKKMYDDMEGDWTRTLILYNGGYAQLNRYNKGQEIASETANYVLKVTRFRKEICHAERIK